MMYWLPFKRLMQKIHSDLNNSHTNRNGFLAKLILRVYCDLTAGYCQPLVSHRKPEISGYLMEWKEDPVPQSSCGPFTGGSRDITALHPVVVTVKTKSCRSSHRFLKPQTEINLRLCIHNLSCPTSWAICLEFMKFQYNSDL